jgi:hypothetical protein
VSRGETEVLTMRALVPVPAAATPRERPEIGHLARPAATFLAHLIATAQQAPQTRMRRRAEPADALAHYAGAAQAVTATRQPGWSI